tara:strand:+ start:195 stop:1325 length:1131 start_codon:yes stop_codon:yes gene_type:complete
MEKELELKKENLKTHLKPYITKTNLYDIIPSPKNIRYRNNIMFSMGYNDKNEITIGPFKEIKSKEILQPNENMLVSNLAISICNYMKIWIQKFSKLPVTEYPSFEGFWRHIQIRQNINNDFTISFRFSNFDKYKYVWQEERYRLLKYFISVPEIKENKFKLLSISYQICCGKKEPSVNEPFYEIYNKGYLIENILGNNFIIKMGGFFQVNMYSSKYIYSIVKSLIKPNTENVLYDMCCGIGMYSIILSDLFYKVIGIDSNNKNITSANENKELNKKKNITFINDRIENVEIKKSIFNKTIIINPPRRGLYNIVLEDINKNIDLIEQLIYVSCCVETLKRDLEMLNLQGKEISHIIPLNQFPNTEHYEIIVNIIKLN